MIKRQKVPIIDRNPIAIADRLIRRSGASSLMSDTKWRKLFSALSTSGLNIRIWNVKFIGKGTETRESYWPDLRTPWAWIDTGKFGPIPLREIEWIHFPRIVRIPEFDPPPSPAGHLPAEHFLQDVDEVAAIIKTLGKYPIELDETGLRVNGHVISRKD